MLPQLQAGAEIGNYTIQRRLGRGGMGEVFHARHKVFDHDYAIKVLKPDIAADPESRLRFLHEAEIAKELIHENVVRTLLVDVDDAYGPYIIMEYMEGQPLDETIPLAPARLAKIMLGVVKALRYIHGKQLAHSDVKPQNIFVKKDDTPVLLDFSIARALGTNTQFLLATPDYVAPELLGQAMKGTKQGYQRTSEADFYALGIVIYESVTGKAPFEGNMYAHLDAPVPSVNLPDPVATDMLDDIIRGLTAKEPDDRKATVDNLETMLGKLADSRQPGAPTGATIPLTSPGIALPPATTTQPGLPNYLIRVIQIGLVLAVILTAIAGLMIWMAMPDAVDQEQLVQDIQRFRLVEALALRDQDTDTLDNKLPLVAQGDAAATLKEQVAALKAQGQRQELTVNIGNVQIVDSSTKNTVILRAEEIHTLRTVTDTQSDASTIDFRTVYVLINVDGQWKVDRVDEQVVP